MSEKVQIALDTVKSSLFLVLVVVGIPLALLGHLSAVLTGHPTFLA
ncbi:MAG: hypothetical protein HY704_16725 [Gemmatimonadetes bacterium]|nr:hypothetical protein [Gemmatimonadota bacterium]